MSLHEDEFDMHKHTDTRN